MITATLFTEGLADQRKRLQEVLASMGQLNSNCVISCTVKLDSSDEDIKRTIQDLGVNQKNGVYILSVPAEEVERFVKALSDFRKSPPETKFAKQAITKPNEPDGSPRTGCLYVGMTRERNLEKRLLQHVCEGCAAKTSALKLPCWAKSAGLGSVPILIEVIPLVDGNHDLTREVEAAFWHRCRPAIGPL